MGASKTLSRTVNVLLKLVLPLVISVGLCWVLFKDDNLLELWHIAANSCDFSMIGVVVLLNIASNFFRALRWRLQLSGAGIETPFHVCLYAIFGTYATNLVFPRLGEVWRCGYVANAQRSPFATVFGTMLADRLADLLTGFSFFLATLFLGHKAIIAFLQRYPHIYDAIMSTLSSPLFWILTTMVVGFFIFIYNTRSRNFILVKLHDFLHGIGEGISSIFTMKGRGLWLLWTVGLWGCYFFQMYFAFLAFPFTRDIVAEHGMIAVLTTFTLGSIAMGIPSNGGLGPYQIAIVFALGLLAPAALTAADKAVFNLDAKAFANFILAISMLVVIVLGLWAFAAIAISKRKSSPTHNK